jgi:hypothetical protein
MSGGLPVARLFGIEVRVSWAWAVLLAGVTFLGSEQAAVVAPSLGAVVHLLVGIAVAVGFLVTVAAHELAHALVGRGRGIPSSVSRGPRAGARAGGARARHPIERHHARGHRRSGSVLDRGDSGA